VRSNSDKLYGGRDNDELLGDSRAVVAAFVGTFSGPLGAVIALTGDRLVLDLDQRSSGDTLRGGDGEDVLAGDNDLVVAQAAAGSSAPGGSFGMRALIADAAVAASGDDLNGEAGDDINEHGNRAIAPRELVTKASISSLSKVSVPSDQPVVDWNRSLGDLAVAGGGAAWVEGFVNALGGESNPNARIRIKL
jgi:hypothetical protein